MNVKHFAVVALLGLVGCGKQMTTDAGTGGGFGTTGGGFGGTGGGSGGGSTGGGGGSTSGGGGGSTTGGGGGSTMDAGTDAGVTMGTSCANAIPLTLGDTPTAGAIDVAGKKVFYKFDATAGDWINASTEANAADDPDTIDTAITLYDAAGTNVIASIDDAYPRFSTDSDLFHHVATTGTICLKVEDWSTWAGETPRKPLVNSYTISVAQLNLAATVVLADTEPNDATPQNVALVLNQGIGLGRMIGTLSSATDVDTYKLTMPAGTTNLEFNLPPLGAASGVGINGYGGGLDRVSVKVIDADAGTVVGAWAATSTNGETAPDSISVVVREGADYVLSVERPAGSQATANDFYTSFIVAQTDNPVETADMTNDVVTTPEVLPLTVDPMNAKAKRGFILGTLGGTDAADHFSIAVLANDVVTVACGSIRTGSGLSATYAMLDTMGMQIQTETETAAADVFWGPAPFGSKAPITAAAAGNLVFKVTGTQDAVNTGKWYRCGIRVTSP